MAKAKDNLLIVMHIFTKEELERARETRRRNFEARRELARNKKEAEDARIAYALEKMRLPDLLTTKQASEIIGVAPKTIREWINQGKLTAYRFRWNRSRISVSSKEVLELQRARSSCLGEGVKKTIKQNLLATREKDSLHHIEKGIK